MIRLAAAALRFLFRTLARLWRRKTSVHGYAVGDWVEFPLKPVGLGAKMQITKIDRGTSTVTLADAVRKARGGDPPVRPRRFA